MKPDQFWKKVLSLSHECRDDDLRAGGGQMGGVSGIKVPLRVREGTESSIWINSAIGMTYWCIRDFLFHFFGLVAGEIESES